MFYLGTLIVSGGLAVNNSTTATPFTIPASVHSVYIVADMDGVQVEMGEISSFQTSAIRGMAIPANSPQGPFHTGGIAPFISVFNPTGATAHINIYATLT